MRPMIVPCLLTLAFLAGPIAADQAYLVQGSRLVQIDLESGSSETVGLLPRQVDALTFATDGQLYGIDLSGDVLLRIDPSTAATTEIGPLGLLLSYPNADMTHDGERLWLLVGPNPGPMNPGFFNRYDLFEVAPETGAATGTGVDLRSSGDAGFASLDGALYVDTAADGLAVFDPTDGATTPLGTGTEVCISPWALATDNQSRIWSIRYNECSVGPVIPWTLEALDPMTGTVIASVANPPDILFPSALAIAPAGALAIPTLGEVGLVLMALTLTVLATAVLRRRRSAVHG